MDYDHAEDVFTVQSEANLGNYLNICSSTASMVHFDLILRMGLGFTVLRLLLVEHIFCSEGILLKAEQILFFVFFFVALIERIKKKFIMRKQFAMYF